MHDHDKARQYQAVIDAGSDSFADQARKFMKTAYQGAEQRSRFIHSATPPSDRLSPLVARKVSGQQHHRGNSGMAPTSVIDRCVQSEDHGSNRAVAAKSLARRVQRRSSATIAILKNHQARPVCSKRKTVPLPVRRKTHTPSPYRPMHTNAKASSEKKLEAAR